MISFYFLFFYNYPFFMCCVTQNKRVDKVKRGKGFRDWDSYTKYKIWVSEATV